MSDSTIDGGTIGLNIGGTSQGTPAEVTITNTTVQNTTTGVQARFLSLTMNSGSIRSSRFDGFLGQYGTYRFNRAIISGNGNGVRVQGIAGTPAMLTMRGASVTSNNGNGIQIEDHADADLGTAASPGGNNFEGNTGVAVSATGQAGQGEIDAIAIPGSRTSRAPMPTGSTRRGCSSWARSASSGSTTTGSRQAGA